MANGSYARAGAAAALGEGLGSFSRALMLIDESRRRADERQAEQLWREEIAQVQQDRWEADREAAAERHREEMASEDLDRVAQFVERGGDPKLAPALMLGRLKGADQALSSGPFQLALETIGTTPRQVTYMGAKFPYPEGDPTAQAGTRAEIKQLYEASHAARPPRQEPPVGTPTFSQAFEAISLPSVVERQEYQGGPRSRYYTRPTGEMIQEASDIAGGRLTGAGLDSLNAARAGGVGPPASLAQPAEAVPAGGRLAGAIPGAAAPAVAAEPEVEVEAPTLDEDEIEELRSWLGQLGPDETRETMLEMGYSEEEVELVLGE